MKRTARYLLIGAFMVLYNYMFVTASVMSNILSTPPLLQSLSNKQDRTFGSLLTALNTKEWKFCSQQDRANKPLTEQERKLLLIRNYCLAYFFSSISSDYIRRYATHCVCCQSFNCSVPPLKDYYVYPWLEFERDMQYQSSTSFPLLTYGSLMHPNSSNDILQQQSLAIGVGLKRVFNYMHPDPTSSLLGLPDTNYPYENLRLNIIYTASLTDCIEGVVGQVALKDLELLRSREIGYDLVKVPIIELGKHTVLGAKDLKEAYVLFAPEYNTQVTFEERYKPHVNYLNLCAEGILLRNGSPARFLRETFLVDKKTTVFEWLQEELKSCFKLK